jgi:outer membrane cobalamin receptor
MPARPRFVVPILAALLLMSALVSRADAATLSGRIADPDGRPIPAVRVLVLSGDATIATAASDSQGQYVVDRLAAGRYTVMALVDGLRAAPATVDLAETDAKTVSFAMTLSAFSETLLVTASQVELPRSRAADSVTVIPAATLEARQVESVPDALRQVPGLGVLRSGGRGAITSVFPRGGDSNYTLMLIDGMKANDFGGGFDFSQLSLADVEQIEVVRGPQSALFGSDAIGGVVQLVTRHGGPFRTRALLEHGGFDTSRAAVSAAGSMQPFTWSASGERWRSDGFTGRAPATGERVTNDEGDFSEGALGLGWSGSRAGEARLDARISSSDRGFPGPFGSNPIGAFTGVDTISKGHRERRQLGVRHSIGIGRSRRVRERFSLSHTALDGRFVSAFAPDDPSADRTRRLDVRAQTDASVGSRVSISAGVEHLRERASSSFIQDAAGQQVEIVRQVTGYFGEARIRPAERVFVTAGLRLEQIHRDPLAPDAFSRPAFPGESIASANPKAAVTYYVRPESSVGGRVGWTRVHTTAGTGIRPADAFEIAFTDNPGLKPERSRSVDGGVSQAFAGGALVVDGTAFLNHYDDLIVTVGRAQRDASRFISDNISNARARGFELSATARPIRGLDVQVGYTWLDTTILPVDGSSGSAPAPFATGDPLIRRPRHQGSFAATFTRDRVTAFFDLSGRSRTLDVEPSFGALFGGVFASRGYAVANAGASIQIARSLEACGRVQNLFDRAYEEVLGFPALGRAATIGVRVAVGR